MNARHTPPGAAADRPPTAPARGRRAVATVVTLACLAAAVLTAVPLTGRSGARTGPAGASLRGSSWALPAKAATGKGASGQASSGQASRGKSSSGKSSSGKPTSGSGSSGPGAARAARGSSWS